MDARSVEHRALRVLRRSDLAGIPRWPVSFAGLRKDHRYYELLEDTLEGYDYRYLAIEDERGAVCAIQPCFLLDQDLVAGINPHVTAPVRLIRRAWSRFLTVRTLMIGCVAGEGHMDGPDAGLARNVRTLSLGIVRAARELHASLIVFKEFPAEYRAEFSRPLDEQGFTRVPSMPMTKLFIGYENFEDYMNRALNGATRRKLRKKFAKAAGAPALEMSILTDATPVIDGIFPLYLAVYERSKLHFEKLTAEFFCAIGRLMPDTVRFFVWRQEGRIVAFTLCMLEGDRFYAEYVGLDYNIALDLHLYFHVVRDMTSWAIANGYKWFCSSGLNYDPKLHLRHRLDPVDLYVRHTLPLANVLLKRILPLMEPTRYDATLRKFSNYSELWS